MPEDNTTIGRVLDGVFDSISTAMDNLATSLVELNKRVSALEDIVNKQANETPKLPPPEENNESVPQLPQPQPRLFDIMPPAVNFQTQDAVNIRAGAHLTVPRGTYVNSIPVVQMNDVLIEIEGHVDSIWIAGANRVAIRGKGSVGRLTVSEWASGSAGHRSSNISVDGVVFNTDRTAMDIQFATNVSVTQTKAENVRDYCLWMSDCRNVVIRGNDFKTLGRESCLRLVSVSDAIVINNDLASGEKHCFRIHGVSSNINAQGNTLSGLRAFMIGTMQGDTLNNISIENTHVIGAAVQFLGLPTMTPNALQNFRFVGYSSEGSNDAELAAYQGVPSWTIER